MVTYYKEKRESHITYIARVKSGIYYTIRSDQESVSKIGPDASEPISDMEAVDCLSIALDEIDPCDKSELPDEIIEQFEDRME